jgi:NADPH:quinone reductase-like Zn-dependent oxidoreductase
MNAAVVDSYENPPHYTTFADPVPTAEEVLIHVTAAGLHPIVKALAKGSHYGSTGQLPLIPGVDGVGRLDDSTRVLFGASRPPYGTFAERSVTKRSFCTPIPDALDDATVAALINPAMSSWAALTQRIQFTAGESILILGATGSAGHLAVQIAKRLGARRIVAVGRNPQALEETKSLGADSTISLNQDRDALVSAFRDEIASQKTGVILDYVWGAPAEALLAAVTQKGLDHESWRIRYIQIGSIAAPTISLPAATLRSSGLEIVGSGFGSVPMQKIFQSLAAILKEAARQPFQIKLTSAPLSEVEKLWNSPEETRLVFQP